jgi:hypothetical protein
MNTWERQMMYGEMKKIKGSVYNDFHSVRFNNLFYPGEDMHHSICIYSSKNIANHCNEFTMDDFVNYVSKIMDYQLQPSGEETLRYFKTRNRDYQQRYISAKNDYDSRISKVFGEILERKKIINHMDDVTMSVNYEPQYSANTLKQYIDSGNATKNHWNDVVIIRLIICQKSFCGNIVINHPPPKYESVDSPGHLPLVDKDQKISELLSKVQQLERELHLLRSE